MIGSPDLVAFTKENDFDDTYVDPCLLPEEFSVPLFPYSGNGNPWSKTSYAKFTKDFILISEFSEQVGPQPLLTIPEGPKVCGTFDLNYFSLRIMSVDYQASFVGHHPGCNYPKLNFVEDSKVVLGDSKEGAFAYVHHLTLYDLEARGFVRPFCMAYISADERKIMQQFLELTSEFSKASECLKTGNRKAFANEIEKKLKDLEYTRTVLHKETELQKVNNGCYSTQAIEKANELANVEKSIYEHKDLLKQITSFPNRKLKNPNFLPYDSDSLVDSADVGQDPTNELKYQDECQSLNVNRRPSYTPQFIRAKSAKCFDKRLKTLEELCDLYFFNQTMDQLKHIEKTFKGDLCYIYTNQIGQALLKKQKYTNFLFEDYSTWEEEESVKDFEKDAVITNLPLAVSVPGEPLSLESYTSCVETVPIKMDPENGEGGHQEAELTKSSPCGNMLSNVEVGVDAEMKGSLSSGESIEVLGTEKLLKAQESQVHSETMTSLSPHYPVIRRRTVTKRANSEDSIEVLSTTDSIIPEDLRASYPFAISEEDCTDTGEDCADALAAQSFSVKFDKYEQNDHVYNTVALVQVDAACCMGQEGFNYEESSPELAQECTANGVVKQEPQPYRQRDLALQVDFVLDDASTREGPTSGLHVYELNPNSLSDETSQLTLDDISDSTSFMSMSTSSDRPCSPFLYGSPITVKEKKKAAQSALRFIRQYHFAQQAIHCLLSGRTLVVFGSDEGTVRKLVNALSIFVPKLGKYGESVKPWLSSPIQLTDLQTWKLIGIHKVASPVGSSILHSLKRYSRYLSVLDVDHKTLCCPPYRGGVMERFVDHRTQIKRGSTYFMHVQSLLTQLCSRAFLYTFCRHLHLPINPGEDQEVVVSRRVSFLHQLGYSQEDCRVLQFLSELIKSYFLQGAGKTDSPPVFGFNYITSVVYKI